MLVINIIHDLLHKPICIKKIKIHKSILRNCGIESRGCLIIIVI